VDRLKRERFDPLAHVRQHPRPKKPSAFEENPRIARWLVDMLDAREKGERITYPQIIEAICEGCRVEGIAMPRGISVTNLARICSDGTLERVRRVAAAK
jgi:hypothetical protein